MYFFFIPSFLEFLKFFLKVPIFLLSDLLVTFSRSFSDCLSENYCIVVFILFLIHSDTGQFNKKSSMGFYSCSKKISNSSMELYQVLPLWSEGIWEQWQWKGTLYSPNFPGWTLIIRLFNVISRTFIGSGS